MLRQEFATTLLSERDLGAAALRSRREEDQEIDVDDAANPSGDPGPSLEQSTKLVSHGSDHLQMIPSKI